MEDVLLPGTYLKGCSHTFKIEKVLWQGEFSITYIASTQIRISSEFKNTIHVVIKEFFMNGINGRNNSYVTFCGHENIYEKYKRKFKDHVTKLRKLKHQNIIKVLESFEGNNTCYYVTKFFRGGLLDSLIAINGGLSETEAYKYISQISDALMFMHYNNILYLDLKPGNVMLNSKGNVVLIDPGLDFLKQCYENEENVEPELYSSFRVGTPGYAPIEQSQPYYPFSPTMDVYALGATMYKMLTGERPPEAEKLLNDGFPREVLKSRNISEETIAAIEKAMAPRKKDRCQTVGDFMSLLSQRKEYK